MSLSSAVLLLALAAPPSLPFPSRSAETINIIQWQANDLPKIYERSDQLPLTGEELTKLAKEGFDTPQLVKMIEERRCACDASADGLIQLKKAGVPKAVLQAVSLHSLKPNRAIELLVTLDFTGDGTEARQGYLYFFVDDAERTRVFTANLHELLSNKQAHEERLDQSDLLRAKPVRRIQLAGQVPLKKYGKHSVLVAASANPSLTHPNQLTAAERAAAQGYSFEYPRASLESVCRLTAGYKRDAVLAYQWHFVGSQFECDWD